MSHTMQAIAWTLIHFCWQAAGIAGIYAIAVRMTARSASHVRYAVALAALVAIIGCAAFTFAWQIWPAADPGGRATAAFPIGDFPRVAQPGRVPSAITAASHRDLAELVPSWLPWVDAGWLIGVCCLAFRNIGGLWMIRRLRTQAATSEAPADVQERFVRIRSALGLQRDVLLRVSEAIAGPVTVGALKSVVLLPLSTLSGLAPEELEVVLAHELAHVRRADFVWNLLQTVAETLFFFHPAVWWISSRVRHERELCCDDLALAICPDRVVYASALFHLEEQRSRQVRLAMALDGNQGGQTLRMRIARILGDEGAFTTPRERRVSMAAALAGVLVLLLSAPEVIVSLTPHVLPGATTIGRAITKVAVAPLNSAAAATSGSVVQQTAQKPAPERRPNQIEQNSAPASGNNSTGTHGTYIDRMKAAGYDLDLDKLIAMKIQNVTPEYAQSMAQTGLGKPTADELISCKIQGVTPEVITELKRQGLDIKSFQDAVSFEIFKVTPEFVQSMKAAGFSNLDSKKLLSLRVQGVTPEYAKSITQQFPGATVDDVMESKIFHIDSDFIASAKAHGFKELTMKKLVQIRISGLLDDEEK